MNSAGILLSVHAAQRCNEFDSVSTTRTRTRTAFGYKYRLVALLSLKVLANVT